MKIRHPLYFELWAIGYFQVYFNDGKTIEMQERLPAKALSAYTFLSARIICTN